MKEKLPQTDRILTTSARLVSTARCFGRSKFRAFAAFIFLFMIQGMIAQTYNMSNTAQTTCSGNFYDAAGSATNYTNNNDFTQTFYPSTATNKLRFIFSSFATETGGYDGLIIYNGNSTSAPIISSGLVAGSNSTNCPAGSFYGTTSPGTITSTAADGSLTFRFRSDNINRAAGWAAAISCITVNGINATAASYGPFCNTTANNIVVNYATTGTVTGTFAVQRSNLGGSFPANTTANLLATISSGSGTITAAVPSGAPLGNYRVRVVSTSPAIASNDNGSDIFVGSAATSVVANATVATICQGSSSQLSSTGTYPVFTTSNTVQQSIPDGIGVTSPEGGVILSSNITIPSNCATISNIVSVTVNATHTYVSDLDVLLYAPNGTSIGLISDNGGSSDNILATFQTGGAALPTGSTAINGTYAPFNPFSNLTGPVAGTWSLRVQDFYSGDTGTLNSWSITFANGQCYSWSPATGLSSTSIMNPVATPAVTTNYVVTVTTPGSCAVQSTKQIVVNPTSVAGTISGATSVCTGTNSTLLTLNGNVGAIQWQSSSPTNNDFANINGATASTYSALNLTATTYYRAIVTSGVCVSATTPVVTMTVNPILTASVSIAGQTTSCQGSSVTFTATPTNGGTTPSYVWKRNGNTIVGETASTYTTTTLVNGDAISVTMTSNATPCLAGSPAVSNVITVTVNPNVNYYTDQDDDGYGDPAGLVLSCSGAPIIGGHLAVLDNTDCSPMDGNVFRTYPFYADVDGDGFGAGDIINSCVAAASPAPSGLSVNNTDCDDSVTSIYQNGLFYVDVDGDGYTVGNQVTVCYGATTPTGYSVTTAGTDCNDNDATIYRNGLFYVDVDGDGYTVGNQVTVCYGATTPTGYSVNSAGSDCNDNDSSVHATFPFYADVDGDGFGAGAVINSCVATASPAPAGLSVNNTDCDDTNAAIYQNGLFYVDVDGDGYTVGNQVTVCYGATTPAGYSTTSLGTDCNDSNAAVNPGAAEIGYNLIDDDCDGSIDEGFPPIVTVPQGCNNTLAAIDSYIYANLVAGAQGYRWRVTTMSGPSAGQVQFLDTPLRAMRITQLVNYAFATAYKIEVGVYYAGFLQPYTATSCSISTPATPTQLIRCSGDTRITAMTDIIYANNIPFAAGYRFKITDPANPSNTQELFRATREFRMSLITNFSVLYNKVYNVQVSIRNTDGTYLPYLNTCEVTTPIFPTVGLQDSQCDTYAVPSNNTIIYADSYPGVIRYVFRLKGAGLPAAGVEVTKNLRTFTLSDFPTLQGGATYNVQVRLVFNLSDVAGSYGKTCSIVAPASARAEVSAVKGVFSAVAYPNPFSENFSISLNTPRTEEVSVKVYDMTGRLLQALTAEASEMKSLQVGDNFPSGVYNIIVNQGTETKTLRVVKR